MRGHGVGKILLRHMEGLAATAGHSEIILNSGPRYMRSGWPFWRRQYGKPITTAKDLYGPRLDAPIWHKILGQ